MLVQNTLMGVIMHFRKSFLLIFLITITGCTRSLILLAPEDLYFLGNYYMDEGNYRAATDQFERILSDYPASEFATDSQFKLAESYFSRGNYSSSSLEFGLFLEFNPGHKLAPQAQYYLAMSEFNRIINPERDITAAIRAKESLELFLRRYRDHPDYDQVELYLASVNDHLQKHEIEVGKAYYRMRHYNAAIRRLEPVLEKDISDPVKQEALFWLARSVIQLNEENKGIEYLEKATGLDSEGTIYNRSVRLLQRLKDAS
jgi:outer membrane protein assembly factor BamD